MQDHLRDPHDQIKIGLLNHLSIQMDPISNLSQLLV
jgi:hypothetical protein